MHSGAGEIFLLGLFVVLAVGSVIFHVNRAFTMLENWARDNGYKIIFSERRYLRTGPYFFAHSKGQDIYHVTVELSDGSQRSGYVRVGGFFFGMLSNVVDVTWDD